MKIPYIWLRITPAHNGKSWKNTAAVGSERRIPCYMQQSDICSWIHLKFTTWSERFFHFEASILKSPWSFIEVFMMTMKSPFSHLTTQPSWNIFLFLQFNKTWNAYNGRPNFSLRTLTKNWNFLTRNECVWTPNRYRCAHDAISREKFCCWKNRHQRSWSTLTV